MRYKIAKFAVAFLSFGFLALCQNTPFGDATPMQATPISNGELITLSVFRTNLVAADLRGNIWLYQNNSFKQERNKGVTGKIIFSGVLNENPFFVSDNGEILFLNSNSQWINVKIPESVYSVSCSSSSVIIAGRTSEGKFNLIETKDFIFFKRFQNGFVDSGLFGLGTLKIFHINELLYLIYRTKDKITYLKTKDLVNFDEIKTSISDFNFAYFDSNRVFYTSNDKLFITDTDLTASFPIGINVDEKSIVKVSNILFAVSPNKDLIHYSNDGTNWASFNISNTRGFNKSLTVFNKKLIMAGTDNLIQIGPFSISESLIVQSELIHAVKVTGNIGQQIEISASDELNGEYKPLTYFTLPSTEYIYNDNRTNKVKQYYKVR
jgi:hypothetical protein